MDEEARVLPFVADLIGLQIPFRCGLVYTVGSGWSRDDGPVEAEDAHAELRTVFEMWGDGGTCVHGVTACVVCE